MARTPRKNNYLAKKSRQPNNENNTLDPDLQAEEDEPEQGDDPVDMLRILQDLRKQHSVKSSAQQAAFQNKKKAIYMDFRKKGKDIFVAGTAVLDDAKAKLNLLKEQEISYEKYFEDFKRLNEAQKTTANRLFDEYSLISKELGSQRSEIIDAASCTLKEQASNRQLALKQVSKQARVYVEQARQNQQDATDASALIKRYKDLLYS